MSEEKEAPAAEAEGTESSGGGGNKLVVILTVVNVVATLGMGVILGLSLKKEGSNAKVEDIVVKEEGHKEKSSEGGGHGEAKEGGHGEAKESSSKKSHDFGKMITLEQFTVNLSTPGTSVPKFVRANISVEVPNDDTEAELNQKMPQVRNAIIDLFNSKRAADLSTPEGRDYIKEEIRNALNAFIVSGKVKGVFFTSFNVQG